MQKKDNIILIGMPGVGKSTIGVILAKVLSYQFLDSDLLIQQEEGRLLYEIIDEEGIEGFLTIENRINSSIDVHRNIIATGGSAVYGKEAMEHFKQIGHVIYLDLEYKWLQKRLGNLYHRGVVLREGQSLQELYAERTPLYEKYADIVITEIGKTPRETMEVIVRELEKRNLYKSSHDPVDL